MTITEKDRVRFRHKALRVIEGLLTAKMVHVKDAKRPVPLGSFQNISLELLYGAEDWFLFHPDETTPSVLWPIDLCLISPKGKDSPSDTFDYSLSHIRSIKPQEARGKAKIFARHMIVETCCGLDGDLSSLETFGGVRRYAAFMNNRWVTSHSNKVYFGMGRAADVPMERDQVRDERDAIMPNLAIGVALRHRYEWAVSLGFDDGPSVRLAVDPTAIKDLFRFREMAETGRRAALMSWVTDHWRVTRTDKDVETYVRKFLRGGHSFVWEGLRATILVPEFDIESEERLILQREEMRRLHSDRRPTA